MIQCRLVTIVWILYTYDASGNRISKLVIPPSGGQGVTTWYTRDAQGNVMSVYETGKTSLNDGRLTQTELHLYGSSRLGLLRRSLIVEDSVLTTPDPYKITMPIFGAGDSIPFVRGNKLFELSNHLGNVLVTVNDKKLGISSNNSTIDYFNPQVVRAQDYYPFGMLQPGRSYNAGGYRYGFNGKENDNEVKGEGEQQDYGMRVYDPRIGKFLSVDPLMKGFPMLTPYQFASNRPIAGIDMDGKEFVLTIYSPSVANSFTRNIQDYKDIYAARQIAYQAINQNMSPKEYEDLKNADIFPNSENDSRKLMRTDLKSATLEYDKNAPQGLTVHMNMGQGDVGGGYTQTWAQSLHFNKGRTEGHEDGNYPVDVRVINSPEYEDFYKDWDFRGTYMSDNASLWIGTASRGTMEGYLKGSGFVQYTVDAIGVNTTLNGFKGGQGISRSGGGIWGKAEPGIPIEPGVLAGWGAQISGGYSFGVGIETGIWGSFQELHDARNFNTSKATFTGGFKGYNVGISARWKKTPTGSKGSSATPAVTNSTLITP